MIFKLPNGAQLALVQANLADAKTSVIVNSVDADCNLRNGAVSAELLRKAGPKLEEQCQIKCPNGLEVGDVIDTSAGNLQCKAVYHCTPQTEQGSNDGKEMVIRILMDSCLEKAHIEQFTSISFPAVGTGGLGMSPNIVVRLMVEQIEEFCTRHTNTTLQNIDIVLYPKDKKNIEVFENYLASKYETDAYVSDDAAWFADVAGELELVSDPDNPPVSRPEETTPQIEIVEEDHPDEVISEEAASRNYLEMVEEDLPDEVIPEEEASPNHPVKPEWCFDPTFSKLLQRLATLKEVPKRVDRLPTNIPPADLEDFGDTDDEICTLSKTHQPHGMAESDVPAKMMPEEKVSPNYPAVKEAEGFNPAACNIVRRRSTLRKVPKPAGWVDAKIPPADSEDLEENVAKITTLRRTHQPDNTATLKRVTPANPAVNDLVRRLRRLKETEDPEPATWTEMATDQQLKVVELDASTGEYKQISDQFMGDVMTTDIKSCTIDKIERIQNRQIHNIYMTLKKHMKEPGELKLWHGTNTQSVYSINLLGFDRQRSGLNATAYGRGNYFAMSANYSRNYSQANEKNERCMYLCKVLTGDYTKGDSNMLNPPPKNPTAPKEEQVMYNSLVDNVKNPTMFVIFHDHQAYPEYLVTFKLEIF